MAHHLSKVRPGDVITAEAFNALVDAVRQGLHFSAAFPLALERTPGGVLLRLAHQTSLKFVKLEDDLAEMENDRTGHVLDYDPAGPQWVDTTESDGHSPQSVEQLVDPYDAGLYLAGERHVVYFDRESGRYLPLNSPGPHAAIAGETIDRGGSGFVTVQMVDEVGDLQETELEVTAHNWFLPRVWANAPCSLAFHPQSRRWFLAQAYSATRALAAVDEASGVTTTDATFDVDNVVALDGFFGENSISGVRNTFGHALDDDAVVALVWNDADLVWETWQGECPSAEP